MGSLSERAHKVQNLVVIQRLVNECTTPTFRTLWIETLPKKQRQGLLKEIAQTKHSTMLKKKPLFVLSLPHMEHSPLQTMLRVQDSAP